MEADMAAYMHTLANMPPTAENKDVFPVLNKMTTPVAVAFRNLVIDFNTYENTHEADFGYYKSWTEEQKRALYDTIPANLR